MPTTEPAWTDNNLTNPHDVADKAQRVRSMFAAIAPTYDLNNRLHSMWRDQAWRRAAVKFSLVRPHDAVLDVACGTGDLAMAFAKGRPGQVVGVDFTCDMLHVAQGKNQIRRDALTLEHAIVYAAGDAMSLPIPDQCFDVVSIAFGIRNVADPLKAIGEFYRVLRPGGRLVILEFSFPANPILRWFYNIYFQRIMPWTATLIARDRSGAYKYLPRSVDTFIDRDRMMTMMRQAGFADVTSKPLTMGIAMIYRGLKRT